MSGAVFVLPVALTGHFGPVAALISTAAWASAARKLWGEAWIVSPSGVFTPEIVEALASSPSVMRRRRRTIRGPFTTVLKTAVKDVRELYRGRHFQIDPNGPWSGAEVQFVWQRHTLFHRGGHELSQGLGRPLVLFVPAMVVWESRQWGVHRHGWGNSLEAMGERPQLRAADVVACGTTRVAELVREAGVAEERIIVTPSGVDVQAFRPPTDVQAVRRRLGVDGKFVVGWAGSFRRFHGVEMAVEAWSRARRAIPDGVMLLVGDGPERAPVEATCHRNGPSDTIFTGTVAHTEMPTYLAAMDVALMVDPWAREFHYSPIKLWEYLACGKAIIAPRVGEISELLTDGVDALLVDPGEIDCVVDAIVRLHGDPALRAALGAAARAKALQVGPWEQRLRQVQAAVAVLRPN